MLKLCLLTLSLGRDWPCKAMLHAEKQQYAQKWGAELIVIDRWGHEALSTCRKEGHLAKVAAVAYYA